MGKLKQIEEMASDIDLACVELSKEQRIDVARVLVVLNYCKIPEGAVVLTREEYDSLIDSMLNLSTKIELYQGLLDDMAGVRKEMVDKFAERLKAQYPPRTDERCTLDDCYMLDKIDEIAKEIMEGE